LLPAQVAELKDQMNLSQQLKRQKEEDYEREVSLLVEKCSMLENHVENFNSAATDLNHLRLQLEENVMTRERLEGKLF
jgi:hypothetical protein